MAVDHAAMGPHNRSGQPAGDPPLDALEPACVCYVYVMGGGVEAKPD